MSMIEDVLVRVKDVRTKVLSTLDEVRPKILYKKPLTEFKGILGSEGVTSLVERVKTRIESIRSGVTGKTTGGAPSSASAQVYWHSTPTASSQVVVVGEEKKRARHY